MSEENINGLEMANVGRRFVSYIIDSALILFIITFPLGFFSSDLGKYEDLVFALYFIFLFLFPTGYWIFCFGRSQTLGMKLMKIRLCRETDGTYPIGYWSGLARWFGMWISSLVLWLGFLWILIDKNNQGWHDKMAGCYVVKAK